jgi:ribosomal-protein-alanine N-acetyltransferase
MNPLFSAHRLITKDDAPAMAAIHALCFPDAWTAELFTDCFTKPEWEGVFGFGIDHTTDSLAGFIIGRTVLDTNDILTFAVNPKFQVKGIGRTLLATYLDVVPCGCILEVAKGNTAAIHLYNTFGFQITASRRDYYNSPDPDMRDAYVMTRRGIA